MMDAFVFEAVISAGPTASCSRSPPTGPALPPAGPLDVRFTSDTVAKVVLQKVSKIPRAAGAVFV